MSMERSRDDDAQHPLSNSNAQQLVAPPTSLVTEAEMLTPAFTAAVEAMKELHAAGPDHTLFDLLDSSYRRRPPKGKTLHVVEHTASLGNKRVAPRGTWTKTSRMKGAPQVVVSRILFPVASDDFRGEPWRRFGGALVFDGSEHGAIRTRMEKLVEYLASGKTFAGRPFGPGARSRAGAKDVEVRNRFDLTLEWMNCARQFRYREERGVVRGEICVPIRDQYGQPVVGMKLLAVHRETRQKWPTRSDATGLATFTNLPHGSYSVRAYSKEGKILVTAVATPRDRKFVHPHFSPIPESQPIVAYLHLHRKSGKRGRAPSNTAATRWLRSFYPELLSRKDRRLDVVEVVRKQVTIGRSPFEPAFPSPRALAAALTGAFLDRKPDAVRKAIGPETPRHRA